MNKLVCKLNNLPIKDTLYSGRVKAPKGVYSYDLVKILKNSGEKVDVITFRDKVKGSETSKILRRYIIKNERWGETFVERNYEEQKEIKIKDPVSKYNKLKVKGRIIKSVTKFDNEFFEKSVETQAITERKEDKPILNISKIKTKFFGKSEIENESQSMFQYSNNKDKKGYEIKTLLKTSLGYIEGIFEPEYNFFGFSKKNIEKLKKDIYFPLHLYSFDEFKKIAPTVAHNQKHKTILPFEVFWFEEKNSSRLGFFDGDINLNSVKLTTRFDVINTAAHEKEHSYQLEQCIFYDLQQGVTKKPEYISENLFKRYKKYFLSGAKYKINDKQEVLLTKKNLENYVTSNNNKKAYQNQFVEMSARISGATAEQDYKKSANFIKKEFPYAPNYMIGYTDDDNLTRAWKILHSRLF